MIKAFIVDDELPAIQGLQSMLELFAPDVRVAGSSQLVTEAVKRLRSEHFDLLFVDISIGESNGFDLLLSLGKQPGLHVVFVTAYKDFAIDAIRRGAVDYLMKPLNPDELVQAVGRVKERMVDQAINSGVTGAVVQPRIGLPGLDETVFIESSEIEYIEGEGNYTKLCMLSGAHETVTRAIGEVESKLAEHGFLRSHRSFLVNLKHVSGLMKKDGGGIVMRSGKTLPISRSKKTEIIKVLEENMLFL